MIFAVNMILKIFVHTLCSFCLQTAAVAVRVSQPKMDACTIDYSEMDVGDVCPAVAKVLAENTVRRALLSVLQDKVRVTWVNCWFICVFEVVFS